MAVEAKSPEDLAKSQLRAAVDAAQRDADAENKKRSGVGLRLHVGLTRGRSPLVIKYEQWDESQPETLPTSPQQFSSLRNITSEKDIVERLWRGDNDILYTAASDPLSEYVDPSWPEDAQLQFRLVVRNYSRGANVSLEDAVILIKPGFEKQFSH